ncbi:GyrI-like domain-containing protein [Cellulosimicrobium terreum]|nr:GyrI-like domain-containing protein [Cellulosimicrobium terreum]
MTQQSPTIEERPDQPYVGVTRAVTMTTMLEIADRIPEVIAWLDEQGVEPVGAAFLRYHVVDMESELVVEAGVPVASTDDLPGPTTGTVPTPGVLPAGRYVVVHHHGHPDELERVTGELLAWAADRGLEWDADAEQRAWGARVESYLTDPGEQPDLDEWDHELAFRLAG